MKKCLILPYFGNFPNFFHLFLASCAKNNDVDFFVFTDQDLNVAFDNFHVIRMTWSEIKQHIASLLGDEISPARPYKLCDFKPAYGFIFQKYIAGYDYWGHCDCDLIFGDLSLLDPYFEKRYERIGEYGHLIFYENSEKVNTYFRTLRSKNCPRWEAIIRSRKPFCFDEHGGMNVLCQENHVFETHPRLFDDIIFYRKNFYSRRLIEGKIDNPRIPVYYEYNQGKLFRHYFLNHQWKKDESLYVHLQKRKMSVGNSIDPEHFRILPNQFLPFDRYDSAELLRLSSAPLVDFKYIKTMSKHFVKGFLMESRKVFSSFRAGIFRASGDEK